MADDTDLPDLTQVPLADLFEMDAADLPDAHRILDRRNDDESVIACE